MNRGSKQGAIGNKAPTCHQSFPPFVRIGFAIDLNVDSVVAQVGIELPLPESRACRRCDPQTCFEHLPIDRLHQSSESFCASKSRFIWIADPLHGTGLVWKEVIGEELYSVDSPAGEPNRNIACPKGLNLSDRVWDLVWLEPGVLRKGRRQALTRKGGSCAKGVHSRACGPNSPQFPHEVCHSWTALSPCDRAVSLVLRDPSPTSWKRHSVRRHVATETTCRSEALRGGLR